MEEKQIKDGIIFHYNPSKKTLTIYPAAAGVNIALPDYLGEEERPWDEYAKEMEHVVLKEGITKIGDLAFAACKSLRSVMMEGSVVCIGESAFSKCGELRNVMIEGSIMSIGKEAFFGCEELRSVTVVGSTASIGDRAFSGCRRLYKIMRPDSVESIGEGVLDHCRYISGVTDAYGVSSGDMDASMERIWSYYRKAAEMFGLQKVGSENRKKTTEEAQTAEEAQTVGEVQTVGETQTTGEVQTVGETQTGEEIQIAEEAQTAKKKEPDEKQANYSLWWFYLDMGEKKHLSDLMKAFLGDEKAKGRLRWGEELPGLDVAKKYLSSLPKNKLNESQKNAIEVALKNPISFIQGPPGTGKTTTILQLASCMALMNKKVAIVSSNSSALEAIYEKKAEFEENTGYKLAKLGNLDTRKEFNREHKDEENHPQFQAKIPAEQFWGASGDIVKRWREPNLKSKNFLERYPIFISTLHSLKCLFQDSGTLRYDYIIVDEVSQVDVVKGLIAMSCAEHLVLVGDEEQLPPVLKAEKIERAEKEWKEEQHEEMEENSVYKMDENQSFLDMCLDIFLKDQEMKKTGEIEVQDGSFRKTVKVKEFLNEHYRCHPGIIAFCRKEIYGERLKIRTGKFDRSVEIPIKILWYEGDYCERCFHTDNKKDEDEKPKKTKRNIKQSEIFMNEEWPKLLERMESGEEISGVTILSPFKGQIRKLKEETRDAYKEYQKEKGENAVKLIITTSLDDKRQDKGLAEDGDYDGNDLSILTIHKSQGREFDIVYLLPAEDAEWEWPWSQKKRLVNVAASRAKKELRVIVSTSLMSEYVRKNLVKTDGEEIERSFGFGEKKSEEGLNEAEDRKSAEGLREAEDKKSVEGLREAEDRKSKEEPGETDPEKRDDNLYVKKLVDYVYEAGEKNEEKRLADWEKGFRFHQTKRISIFDIGKEEKKREREKFPYLSGLSDPEVIVAATLKKMPVFQENNLIFYCNVSLGDIQMPSGQLVEDYLSEVEDDNISEDDKEYIRAHAEFDFVICRKSGEILMTMEVDGLYHRYCETMEEENWQKRRDEQKDRLAEFLFGAACYKGNRSGQGEKAGSFVFLRLPCDGSTCLESRVLWDKGDEELRKEFFTIDDILEKAVAKSTEGACQFKPKRNEKVMLSTAKKLAYLQYRNFETFIRKDPMSDAKRSSLEELRKFSYQKNAAPDYSDRHVQERYLLQYFSAYACEYLHVYRKMYKMFSGRDFCKKQIEVTSLGCGNMVDYWGLAKAAMETYGKKEALIHYIGVDAADWKIENLVLKREVDFVQFVQDRAESYLEKQEELTSDVYVFPKSLSEYNRKQANFERICKAFSVKRFTKDEVCILTVFRSNESDVEEQKKDNRNYCDKLAEAVETNGFHRSYDRIWGMEAGKLEEKEWVDAVEEPKKIWNIDDCFKYSCDLYGKILKVLETAEEEMEKAGLSKKHEVRNPLIHAYWRCRMMVFERREKRQS